MGVFFDECCFALTFRLETMKGFLMRILRLLFVLPVFWLTVGCGGSTPPPPPLDDPGTQAAIEAEDARVHEEESQQ